MEKKIIHECTQSHTYTHIQKMKKQMYNRKQEHVLLNGATFIISFVLHVTLVLLQHSHVLCLFTLFFYFFVLLSYQYLTVLFIYFFFGYSGFLLLLFFSTSSCFFFSFLLQFHRVFLEMSSFSQYSSKLINRMWFILTYTYIHIYNCFCSEVFMRICVYVVLVICE